MLGSYRLELYIQEVLLELNEGIESEEDEDEAVGRRL